MFMSDDRPGLTECLTSCLLPSLSSSQNKWYLLGGVSDQEDAWISAETTPLIELSVEIIVRLGDH